MVISFALICDTSYLDDDHDHAVSWLQDVLSASTTFSYDLFANLLTFLFFHKSIGIAAFKKSLIHATIVSVVSAILATVGINYVSLESPLHRGFEYAMNMGSVGYL